MSVRQYIGARYVPRFLGMWNNITQYEALDVVDNGSGTSYIARKIVPAGTPLTNPEFWFIYGASSGAILDLQDRMNSAENDIANLNEEVGRLVDRKIVFIGDSYAGDLVPNNYIEIAAGILGLTANTDYYLSAVGGAGFYGDSGSVTFLARLQALDSTITDKDSITDIIILGGINDRDASVSDMDQRMAEFNTYARANYPNAKISLGAIGWSTNTGYLNNYIDRVIPTYSKCGKYGWTFYNNIMYTLHCRSFMADSLHPTQDAHYLLAYNLVDCILHGSCNVEYVMDNDSTRPDALKYTFTVNSNFTQVSDRKFEDHIKFYIDNGVLSVEMTGYVSMTRSSAASMRGFTEIGKMNNFLMGFSGNAKQGYIPCVCETNIAGQGNVILQGELIICNEGTVYVRIFIDRAIDNFTLYQTSATLSTIRN